MAYIEAFLLYLAIITAVFIVTAFTFSCLIWIFARIFPFYKRRWFLKLFLKDSVLKKQEDIQVEDPEDLLLKDKNYSDSFISIFRANFITWFAIIYFSIFSFVYINQSIEYYGSDRAYPKAKAYAITGNLIQMYHMIFFYNPRFNLAENDFDKKFMKAFDFILERMNQYIPEDDPERDYWLYKYKYAYIVVTRYTPVTQEYAKNGFSSRFFVSELEAAAYESRFLTMMDEMHRISKNLMYKKLKDKNLERAGKFVPVAKMSYYLYMKMIHYTTLNPLSYQKKRKLMYSKADVMEKFIDYFELLLKLDSKIKNDPDVKKTFDNNGFLYVLLYSSILNYYDDLINYETIVKDIYPCNSKKLNQFLEYHKQYYEWTKGGKSFLKMSSKAKKNAKNISKGFNTYVIAKYVCKRHIDYFIDVEEYFMSHDSMEALEENMLRRLDYKFYELEKIKKMKENYEKGK